MIIDEWLFFLFKNIYNFIYQFMFILYNYYARDIKISLKIIVLILTSVVSVFFFFWSFFNSNNCQLTFTVTRLIDRKNPLCSLINEILQIKKKMYTKSDISPKTEKSNYNLEGEEFCPLWQTVTLLV